MVVEGVVSSQRRCGGGYSPCRIDSTKKNHEAIWTGTGAGNNPESRHKELGAAKFQAAATVNQVGTSRTPSITTETPAPSWGRPASARDKSCSQDDTLCAHHVDLVTNRQGHRVPAAEFPRARTAPATGWKEAAEATPPGGQYPRRGSDEVTALGLMPVLSTNTMWGNTSHAELFEREKATIRT